MMMLYTFYGQTQFYASVQQKKEGETSIICIETFIINVKVIMKVNMMINLKKNLIKYERASCAASDVVYENYYLSMNGWQIVELY